MTPEGNCLYWRIVDQVATWWSGSRGAVLIIAGRSFPHLQPNSQFRRRNWSLVIIYTIAILNHLKIGFSSITKSYDISSWFTGSQFWSDPWPIMTKAGARVSVWWSMLLDSVNLGEPGPLGGFNPYHSEAWGQLGHVRFGKWTFPLFPAFRWLVKFGKEEIMMEPAVWIPSNVAHPKGPKPSPMTYYRWVVYGGINHPHKIIRGKTNDTCFGVFNCWLYSGPFTILCISSRTPAPFEQLPWEVSVFPIDSYKIRCFSMIFHALPWSRWIMFPICPMYGIFTYIYSTNGPFM